MNYKTLFLNKKCDKRLRQGHLWIYSNEVDRQRSALTDFAAGEQVQVVTADGECLGVAFISPHNLICGRLVSRQAGLLMTDELLCKRLQQALSLREQVFEVPCYRLVYGDSDGLPGLVIDRFFDVCVVQISLAGMELYKSAIVSALQELVQARCVVFKNDGKMRAIEGLTEYVEFALGAEQESVALEENGVRFLAPLTEGQKTAWFYDHRMSRLRLQSYARGKRVLDLFSYVGGWGIQALAAGAASLTCVDASALALDYVAQNAALNQCAEVQALQGDAFHIAQQLRHSGQRFDIVIADPPALIPRKKHEKEGLQAYHRLNQLAMRLLDEGGVLVSGSCSMHLAREQLRDVIRTAGRKTGMSVQILEEGGQGPDHPVLPAIPETEYLKASFVRVMPQV